MFVSLSINITARRYATAVYAVVVCLSVRLSQAGPVPNRLNVGSRKQRHTIARDSSSPTPKKPRRNSNGITLMGGGRQI